MSYSVQIRSADDVLITQFIPQGLDLTSHFQREGKATIQLPSYVMHQGSITTNPVLETPWTVWDRVCVYFTDVSPHQLVWEGWISSIRYGSKHTSITCTDIWGYLQRKLVFGARNVNDTVKNILEFEWNRIDQRHPTGISIQTDIHNAIEFIVRNGTSFAQVLRILQTYGYEARYAQGMITVSDTVGEVHTTGLIYDASGASSTNAYPEDDFVLDGTKYANTAIGQGIAGNAAFVSQPIPTSREEIGRVKFMGDYSGVFLEQQTQQLLDDAIESQQPVVFQVSDDVFTPGQFQTGDWVPVSVRTDFPLVDFVGQQRVITTQITLDAEGYSHFVTVSGGSQDDSQLTDHENRITQLEGQI